MNKPEFTKHYGINNVEYRFKFYNTNEREIHKQIIHYLVEELAKLKLHKDSDTLRKVKE
jgi:hypothetical protein